ncbi:TlpA disulfide reductase family protein [Aureivirga sp. CE67]|uniref:TlpA disulfide reductase family protein n=1 Tax=Aureivirga sp. CE67 TaxID=1788983 RepID=UPI0018CAB41B|nr:TlpA disulfide reductase family protein [Aureivirga sp. CE67]
MKLKNTILPLALLALISCDDKKELKKELNQKIVLKGKVVESPETKFVLLSKIYENQADFEGVKIPLNSDGSFEYTLEKDEDILYQISLNNELERGTYYANSFFLEKDTIQFEIYDIYNSQKNVVESSSKTIDYKNFSKEYNSSYRDSLNLAYDKRNELYENHKFHSPKGREIDDKYQEEEDFDKMEKLRILRDDLINKNQFYSSEGKQIIEKIETYEEKIQIKNLEFLLSKPLDIVSYTKFINSYNSIYRNHKSVRKAFNTAFSQFENKFPNHPYTEFIKNRELKFSEIKVGNKYIPFKTKDREGNEIDVSKIVKNNKITLLDFWATWCSPCIRKSKALEKTYNNYHDEGFEIVGVVGRLQNIKDYDGVIKRLKYPWKNYVELNREYNLWNLYNLEGLAGRQFLVNNEGIILAENPTKEEVLKFLKEANSL